MLVNHSNESHRYKIVHSVFVMILYRYPVPVYIIL